LGCTKLHHNPAPFIRGFMPLTTVMDKESFNKATFSDNNITLGNGYLGNAMMPMHTRCLKNMDVSIKDVQSAISLERTSDLSKVSQSLGINLKAKAGWGKFSASAAANYLREIQEDDYTISFTYQNVISGYASLNTSDYYGENALSDGGLAALKKSEDAFIARCGDQYIQGIDMGAVLNVTMRIKFASQEQKKEFEASIEGKFDDIASASAKIQNALKSSGNRSVIDLIAYQTGGQPNNLAQIFGADKEHAIIHCDMEHLDNCAKAMDDVLAYAEATGSWTETGFAKQIKIGSYKFQVGKQAEFTLLKSSPPVIKYTIVLKCLNL